MHVAQRIHEIQVDESLRRSDSETFFITYINLHNLKST
jgi:hypothetical protein